MSNGVKNWTTNQQRLIAWLALPEELRNPRTQHELAQEIGVREETISRWKRQDGLIEAAGAMAREAIKAQLADIYGALAKKAKAGSLGHIKVCLEVAGHYVERGSLEVSGPGGGPIRQEVEYVIDWDDASEAIDSPVVAGPAANGTPNGTPNGNGSRE